jgi:hypothetical protein
MVVNFLILGAQKGGSTWLYDMLRKHPGIGVPPNELHFFSSDENFHKGPDWYHHHFGRSSEGIVYGEKTPEYLTVIKTRNRKTSTLTADRIRSYNPSMKLIVVLREPISRLRSAINHMYRTRRIPPWTSVNELLLGRNKRWADAFSLLENGLYHDNLAEYFQRFAADQICVLLFETDVLKTPLQSLERVCNFLGVPFMERYFPEAERVRNEYQMSFPALVANYFVPLLRPVSNRLNHLFPAYKAHIDEDMLAFLQRYYRPANERLKSLIGDLPDNWTY